MAYTTPVSFLPFLDQTNSAPSPIEPRRLWDDDRFQTLVDVARGVGTQEDPIVLDSDTPATAASTAVPSTASSSTMMPFSFSPWPTPDEREDENRQVFSPLPPGFMEEGNDDSTLESVEIESRSSEDFNNWFRDSMDDLRNDCEMMKITVDECVGMQEGTWTDHNARPFFIMTKLENMRNELQYMVDRMDRVIDSHRREFRTESINEALRRFYENRDIRTRTVYVTYDIINDR